MTGIIAPNVYHHNDKHWKEQVHLVECASRILDIKSGVVEKTEGRDIIGYPFFRLFVKNYAL